MNTIFLILFNLIPMPKALPEKPAEVRRLGPVSSEAQAQRISEPLLGPLETIKFNPFLSHKEIQAKDG